MIRAVGFLMMVTVVAACEAQVGDHATELPDLGVTTTAGAVEASFRAGPWSNGEQTVWVRLTGLDGLVGSFQGRVQFDASRLDLLDAAMTDEAGGADFGILNTEGTGTGVLPFAGFSIEGFEVRDVLSVRFRTVRALQAGDLELVMDVVGTPEGAQVADDELAIVPAMRPVTTLELGR